MGAVEKGGGSPGRWVKTGRGALASLDLLPSDLPAMVVQGFCVGLMGLSDTLVA